MSELKMRMKNGECVFGTWCMIPNPTIVDILGRTGIDFVVLDLEHGLIGWETVDAMVLAAKAAGIQPIIRVGDDHENTILRALETDSRAVLVPHISDVPTAERVVSAARYTPGGLRGLSPYTRCHDYTHIDLSTSMKMHAAETLVGVLVEGQTGIENLERIVQVKGLDLVYLGMYDISQSVGRPGELEHPEVTAQLLRCLKIIGNSNCLAGTFARDINSCIQFREMGFDFVAYVADSYGLKAFFDAASREFFDK